MRLIALIAFCMTNVTMWSGCATQNPNRQTNQQPSDSGRFGLAGLSPEPEGAIETETTTAEALGQIGGHSVEASIQGHDLEYSKRHKPEMSKTHNVNMSVKGHLPYMSSEHTPEYSTSHDSALSVRSHYPIVSLNHDPNISKGPKQPPLPLDHESLLSNAGHDYNYSKTHTSDKSNQHVESLSVKGHYPHYSVTHEAAKSMLHTTTSSLQGHFPYESAKHSLATSKQQNHDPWVSAFHTPDQSRWVPMPKIPPKPAPEQITILERENRRVQNF